MTTALQIISQALRSINALGEGETPSAAQSSTGLESLNAMLSEWSTQKLLVYQVVQENFPFVVGQSDYTMGAGGNFNTTRPTAIENVFVRFQDIDYPVDIVTMEQFNQITFKAQLSQVPFVVNVDTAFPLTTLKFWSVPNTTLASVYISSRKAFVEYTSLATVVNLPPGYERAISKNLAVDLGPEYGAMGNPVLIAQAARGKANLKRINYTPIVLDIDSALPQGRNNWQDWRY